MTYILSFIVAFGVTAIAGQILIPVLRRLKAGQSIREDGPTWHMSKQGTPTMGGLMFILGIAVAVVAAGWQDSSTDFITTSWCSCLPWCSAPSASSTISRSCATTPTRD